MASADKTRIAKPPTGRDLFAAYSAHCDKCKRCRERHTFYNLREDLCHKGWALFIEWFGEDEYERIVAPVRRKLLNA